VTYHSAAEYPYTFSPDSRDIVFGAARMDAASNRQYPTGSQPELYRVPAAGGRPDQVLTTPAEDARFSANGSLMLYHDKKGGENAWRKHQTSAIARDIWLYDSKAGTHRKITSFAGEDRSPVFTDNDRAFFYLSEASGSFNVHRMALDGGGARQVTSFKGMPVRFLTASNSGTLSFGYDGQIYTVAPGAQPRRVAVSIATDSKANNERIMAVTGGARDMTVSPSGKEVAFIFRGDVFVTSVDGGITKRITNTPEQEAGVEFSPDARALVYASERGSRWAIYEARRARAQEPYFYASTIVRETPLLENDKQNYQPAYSPDGKELAWIEDRNTLKVMTLANKETRTLLTEKELFATSPSHHFDWSPDGQWMLFNYSVPGIAPGEVGIVSTDGKGKAINLTESGFNDGRAKWIQGGKAMLWFSNRDGLKSVAQAGGSQQDVFAMYFTGDAWDRARLTKEELTLVKEAEEKAEKEKAEREKADKSRADSSKVKVTLPAPVPLDLERAPERKQKLTIHSSVLGDALVSKDGETLFYLARFERGMNLWSTNLRTRETKMIVTLNANGGSMAWDKEQKIIFLLADGAISKIDPITVKRDVVAINGEMMLDGDAERESMFDHVWRKTRDTFYSAGYHGVNWSSMRPLYAKYLPHISNNYEFAEMLSEMLGELNISHSGASFGTSTPSDDATASLGVFADPTYTGAGVKVVETLREGPLDKAGMDITPGSIIEAVDGLPIAPDRDVAQFLNRKAGKNVLLTIADGNKKRDITVRPVTLAEENRLLYSRWVRRNQEEVGRLSGGALGYVHIPGMNDGAYRTTFEEVMGKYATKQGMVVDTRFNGGGDLVADLAMFLSGKKFFDYTTDTRSSGYEPNFRWTKPSVSLANEANYSDGHCYAYTYKELKLGPLVGMPTPGTCTFAGWETLNDGLRWGVPGMGVKDSNTGKYLENLQTDPDVKVMNEYGAVSKGKDQQLEAAIAELMKMLRVLK
ncbi:MAG: S41 family peptidase, partial [Gemmatimonas sp.]